MHRDSKQEEMFYRTCVVSVFNESSRLGVVLTAIATSLSSSFVLTVTLSGPCVSAAIETHSLLTFTRKRNKPPSVTKIFGKIKKVKNFLVVILLSRAVVS